MGFPKIIQLIDSAAKTSGDQTIAGTKTFSFGLKGPLDNNKILNN